MYIIIRLIIGCIFFVCLIMAIRTKSICNRAMCIVSAIASVGLSVVLTFLPFENLFMTFDSPKESYEYYTFGEANVTLVVEGDKCDFVVDRKNGSDKYLIIPKTEDGWKIGIGSNIKRIVQKTHNGVVIYIYQYKNTNDYFITVFDTNGGKTNVSDCYDTKFYYLENNNDYLKKTFVTYYAHVFDFNSQYFVVVDGDLIMLGDN